MRWLPTGPAFPVQSIIYNTNLPLSRHLNHGVITRVDLGTQGLTMINSLPMESRAQRGSRQGAAASGWGR